MDTEETKINSYYQLWHEVLMAYIHDVFDELLGYETGYFTGTFFSAATNGAARKGKEFGPPDGKRGQQNIWKIEKFFGHRLYEKKWRHVYTALDDIDGAKPQLGVICERLEIDTAITAKKILSLCRRLIDEGQTEVPGFTEGVSRPSQFRTTYDSSGERPRANPISYGYYSVDPLLPIEGMGRELAENARQTLGARG